MARSTGAPLVVLLLSDFVGDEGEVVEDHAWIKSRQGKPSFARKQAIEDAVGGY